MGIFQIFTSLPPVVVTLTYVFAITIFSIVAEFGAAFLYANQLQSFVWMLIFLIPIGWSIGINSIINKEKQYTSFYVLSLSMISLIYSLMIFVLSFSMVRGFVPKSTLFEALVAGFNIAGFISIPLLFWVTAKRLVSIEKSVQARSRSELITFFQIIYFPFGIYWLFPRMKAIKVHSQD